MSSLERISTNYDNTLLVEIEKEDLPETSKELPLDILKKILSYLDKTSMQSASQITKHWNHAFLDLTKQIELSKIQKFRNFLSNNSNTSYITQREELFSAGKMAQIFDSEKNLTQVKSSICELKEDILKILKDIDIQDLCKLNILFKDEVKPKLFEEDIFELAQINQRIDQANLKECAEKDRLLWDISKELTKDGYFDKAIEVAHMISKDKSFALFEIFNQLMKENNIGKATEVVKKIYADDKDPHYIRLIQNKFLECGYFDKAAEVAHMLPDEKQKFAALLNICNQSIEKGLIDKAIEVANTIPDNEKNSTFYYICNQLVEKGSIDKSIEVANTIPSDFKKNDAFSCICKKLIEKDYLDKAIEIAHIISDNPLKHEVIMNSVDKLLESNNINKIMEIVNTFSENPIKFCVLKKSIDKLVESNLIDKAIEVAYMTLSMAPSDNIQKALAFYNLCNQLIEKDYINEAKEIANTMPNEDVKKVIFMLISDHTSHEMS